MMLKLLIVEDASSVVRVVEFAARMAWPDCRVTVASGGAEALKCLKEEQPDMVVLDIEMPPPDGFAICRAIRESSDVPILMLTVRESTLDKVRAFELGADDYLTKPFDHVELLARLRALLRRASTTHPLATTASSAGGDAFALDPGRHEVRVGERVIQLTTMECRLLEELMRHAGAVLPYSVLLEKVWGPEYTNESHYLKVFVQRLRHKLDDNAKNPRYIQTEWGIGYSFVPPRAH